MIENDLIFFETKIKIKINFYKFTGGDLDHLKDQVQLKDLDLFHQDQLILNNPGLALGCVKSRPRPDGASRRDSRNLEPTL